MRVIGIYAMKKTTILLACLMCGSALAAGGYPVSGRWGQSASSEKGAIDCGNKRVIEFKGDQRTDSNGGVPGYRNVSVTQQGPMRYRIVDTFTTGQISNGHVSYTLSEVDADHIELNKQPGGMLKLQRCK